MVEPDIHNQDFKRNLMTNTRFDFMGTNKKSLIIVSASSLFVSVHLPSVV